MEPKKSNKAQLENKKGLYIQVGLVIALSLVLISFEWTSNPPLLDDIVMVNEIEFEDEIILIPRDEQEEEQIEPEVPEIIEVIEIVENEEDTKGWDIDNEVGEDTEYDFSKNLPPDEVLPSDIIFINVQEMPTFNGGDPATEFRKYIGKNLSYPDLAAQNGVSGRVQVEFVVNSIGEVVDAKVTRSVDPSLDKEAIRVIMSSPKWEAGKQRGKAVKVLFSFPINFVLQ